MGWICQRGEGEEGKGIFENEQLWDVGFVNCQVSSVSCQGSVRETRGECQLMSDEWRVVSESRAGALSHYRIIACRHVLCMR